MKKLICLAMIFGCSLSTVVFCQLENQHVAQIRKDTAFVNFIRNNRIKSLKDTVSMIHHDVKWNLEMIHHFDEAGMLTAIDGYYFVGDKNVNSSESKPGFNLTYDDKGNLTQFNRSATSSRDLNTLDTINNIKIDYSNNTLKYFGFEYRDIKKKWSILDFTNHHIDTVPPNAIPGHYQKYFALLEERFSDSNHYAQLIDYVIVQWHFEWSDINRYQDFNGANEIINYSPFSTPFTIHFLAGANSKSRFWFANTEESPMLNKPNRIANDLYADEYLHECNLGAYTHIFYFVTDTIKNTIIEKRYQFLPESNGLLVLDIIKIYDYNKNLQIRYFRNALRGEYFEHNKDFWIRQDFNRTEGKLSSYNMYVANNKKQKTNDPMKMKYSHYGDFVIVPRPDRFVIKDYVKHLLTIDGRTYHFTNYQ